MTDKRRRVDRRTVLKAAGPIAALGLSGCSQDGGGDGGSGGGDGGGSDGGNGGGQQSYNWTVGTSGEETATHASGVAFANVVSQNSDSIEMSAQTTGGTTANNRLVDEGDVDVAQSTSPMVWRADTGRDPYTDPEIEATLCQTFSYMTLDIFLVKRNTEELSDIETATDIPTDGSIDMSWGPRGTSAWDTQIDVLSLSGVDNPEETFDLEVMGLGDQAGAMRDGRIDIATVYTANTQTIIGWIQELSSTTDLEVISYPISEADVQDSGLPIVYSETSADVFDQDVGVDSFPTISIGYFTTIPADIPAEPVYEYTSILMDNAEAVHDANAVLSEHGPDFATEYLVQNGEVPVHPGTEQWYRENDLWNDNLVSLDDYEG